MRNGNYPPPDYLNHPKMDICGGAWGNCAICGKPLDQRQKKYCLKCAGIAKRQQNTTRVAQYRERQKQGRPYVVTHCRRCRTPLPPLEPGQSRGRREYCEDPECKKARKAEYNRRYQAQKRKRGK